LASSVGVFTALLKAIVDRGADVLEHLGAELDRISRNVFQGDPTARTHAVRSTNEPRRTLSKVGAIGQRASQARDVLLGVGRSAPFANDIGQTWIGRDIQARLGAVSKDVTSLDDYEAHVSAKVQFLLDATLGYIRIQQNDILKVLTIASVAGVPPTLLAGVWGMNFKNMPELDWLWGYPLALLAIVLSGVLPLAWFKKRGWF
jgi:magnesium transporter